MEEGDGTGDGSAVEVVLPEEGRVTPSCPHGPTLLFEKLCKGEEKSRRFFACSACRDRKDCSFFQWEDDKVSEARLLAREAENRAKRPAITPQESWSRFQKFCGLPVHDRRFCADCQLLLLPAELAAHTSHSTSLVTPAQLQRPSLLLHPLDNKKSQAQFLFTERSARFLLDSLAARGYRKLLCVGTPRLQELIRIRNLEPNQQPMKSLLLDIDFRYAQFYSQDQFCHYNMFNHHFFGSEASGGVLRAFLTEDGDDRVAMVADPPFGGLVKPLANTFSLISQMWKKLQPCDSTDFLMPMMWIFPYFFEPRILECLPSLVMLDYQVDYDNHPLYKHGRTGRRQSPVRVFTNLPARDMVLPRDEGYRFCSVCQRYVCSLNKHCNHCNICPSKDGREWKHCSTCGKCVKPSWRHCRSCDRCALPNHPCGSGDVDLGCFVCGSRQHKQRSCPEKHKPRKNMFHNKGKKVSNQKTKKSGAARRAGRRLHL